MIAKRLLERRFLNLLFHILLMVSESTTFSNKLIMLVELKAVSPPLAASLTSPSAAANTVIPSNSPAFPFTPPQMFCSFFSATNPATCPIKKSENFGGNWSFKELYPIEIASQSEIKSCLQSSRFTWNCSGCRIRSVNVTVAVSEKSHEASFITLASVATFLITSLNFNVRFNFDVSFF